MRYFLTGATGFIGGRLAALLRAQGHEVVALVRSPEKAQNLAELGVTLAKGDITDLSSLRAAMPGCESVFHVAGWYKIGPGARSNEGVAVNVEGTRNVLGVMQELAIPKGVYTSTLAIFSDTHGELPDENYRYDGPHLSEYDRTKAAAHDIADAFIAQGLPLVVVQPGLVYGPGDTSAAHQTFQQFLTRKLPLIPQGAAYCWAHVDDIVLGHWLAMEKGKPGESYIIAGPPHTLVEALEIAEKLTGIPLTKRRASPGMLRALASTMALLESIRLTLPEQYSSEFLRVSAGTTYLGDNSKAKQELGYAPRSLEEGLPETLAWEQAQLKR
ncbi:MAG: NAD-dependent epimerase/dehydratase family protein [Armatimonadetes bacterium]|nr:NAD-dependent epimerase/dehydratase family protein [Armatimonadota bacterium]